MPHFLFWFLMLSMLAGCYTEAPPAGPDVVSVRLHELLADPDPDMRRTAAEALGKIGLPSSMAGLIVALHDREAPVRAAAALSLGRIGESESAVALIRALSDPTEMVRMAAAVALGEIEPTPMSEALILARLRQGNDTERLAAAQALLGLNTVSFSNELERILQDTNPTVRQMAAALSGESGDEKAVPHLMSLLQRDPAAGVRTEAAFRLGKIGDGSVMSNLARIAETDPDAQVRGWARWASQQIKQSPGSGSETRPIR